MLVIFWRSGNKKVQIMNAPRHEANFQDGDIHATLTHPWQITMNSVYIKNKKRLMNVGDVCIRIETAHIDIPRFEYCITGFCMCVEETLFNRALAARLNVYLMVLQLENNVFDFLSK